MLKLKDASIFQRENLILTDVNLDIKQGDFNYIIGKTGSGKSSLMKTLYGDLPLQKGEGNIVTFFISYVNCLLNPFSINIFSRIGNINKYLCNYCSCC